MEAEITIRVKESLDEKVRNTNVWKWNLMTNIRKLKEERKRRRKVVSVKGEN
jgi:hypothetical protein